MWGNRNPYISQTRSPRHTKPKAHTLTYTPPLTSIKLPSPYNHSLPTNHPQTSKISQIYTVLHNRTPHISAPSRPITLKRNAHTSTYTPFLTSIKLPPPYLHSNLFTHTQTSKISQIILSSRTEHPISQHTPHLFTPNKTLTHQPIHSLNHLSNSQPHTTTPSSLTIPLPPLFSLVLPNQLPTFHPYLYTKTSTNPPHIFLLSRACLPLLELSTP